MNLLLLPACPPLVSPGALPSGRLAAGRYHDAATSLSSLPFALLAVVRRPLAPSLTTAVERLDACLWPVCCCSLSGADVRLSPRFHGRPNALREWGLQGQARAAG